MVDDVNVSLWDVTKYILCKSCRIALLAHLYGCVKDLCDGMEDEVITTAYATELIIDTIYKGDPLFVESYGFQELQDLLETRIHDNDL